MRKLCLNIVFAIMAVGVLGAPVAAQPTQEAAAATGPYSSPMRTDCTAELAKDKGWRAELRNELRTEVHQEDADLTMTNKKHVVMSYAALWMLSVAFLVLLWLRQQRLSAEIARLESDLKKAAAE
jgi:hypothetical protein